MHAARHGRILTGAVLSIALVVVAVGLVTWFFVDRQSWARGEALHTALEPMTKSKDADTARVAGAILDNYKETRSNASRWSGIYWTCTFAAAGLSALAGLILKFESRVGDEKLKKDLAAVSSVVAALLITISTAGDFQRKWQSNRLAAAELERMGYNFLAKNGEKPREYFVAIGDILHTRHLSIIGQSDKKSGEEATSPD